MDKRWGNISALHAGENTTLNPNFLIEVRHKGDIIIDDPTARELGQC
jgi:hypothetical protein